MTIAEIFETMTYGPAPESATPALNWIASCSGPTQEEHMEAVAQMEMETITSVWTRRDAVALVALVTFVSLAAYWLTV